MLTFPKGFLWGTATSAYQVEGSTRADGRGESIWDRFAAQAGHIDDGSSGEPACDHYRRWAEDIALMKRLGFQTYRFSVAWPRVFPTGAGQPNGAGLDFYDRLVDALLAAGIEPLVTLYHWDLPQALQDQGGWSRRETAWRFQELAATVLARLGDRVRLWVTVNEPWVAAFLGHLHGEHAPGLRDLATAIRASHHLLLAHGLGLQTFRQMNLQGKMGIALDLHAYAPASPSPEDQEAAERVRALESDWFLDPLFRGSYPPLALAWYRLKGVEPPVEAGDLELISQPLDFVGVNYYTRHVIAHDPAEPWSGLRQVPAPGPVTAMGWEVYPEGLREVLNWVYRTYVEPRTRRGTTLTGQGTATGPAPAPSAEPPSPWDAPCPLLVTENGAAYPDELMEQDGELRVDDPERIAYLDAHLRAVWASIQDGTPVAGFYAWSFLDNFEWARGYTRRFGLVYVDYPTQRRIPKASALWYRDVIARHGLDA